MYPTRDQFEDQFDELLELHRTGKQPLDIDPEQLQMLRLADRLERELPEDLPDPAFTANLRQQLLSGEQLPQPVDLERERWQRRLTASTWRLGAAAAVLGVVVIAAVVMAMGPLAGDSGDEVDPASQTALVQPSDDVAIDSDGEAETEADAPESGMTTLQSDDAPAIDQRRWTNADLPPFDLAHVVMNPLLVTGIALQPLSTRPDVTFDPEMTMPEMPLTATIYYLSAPPDPEALLISIQHALDIDGELAVNEDEPHYRILGDDGQEILVWKPASAFFAFYAPDGEFVPMTLGESASGPIEVATAFLEQINADLYSMDFTASLEESGGGNVLVRFTPESLPQTGMEMTIGMTVVVNADETIREAHIIWLSLIDQRDVELRDAREAQASGTSGDGFWPPHDVPAETTMAELEDATMVHLLTRLDSKTFVLQPAVKFIGKFYGEDGPLEDDIARYYVPAIDKRTYGD